MSLLYMDSFDHYATATMNEKGWTGLTFGGVNSNTIAVQGRHSSSAYRSTQSGVGSSYAYMGRTLTPGDASFVIGVAIRTNHLPLNPTHGEVVIFIQDTGTTQLNLCVLPDYRIRVTRGSHGSATTLATSASPCITINAYAFIEFKGTIHNSTGTIQVRVDGVDVIPATGSLDTQATANASWNQVYIGHYDASSSASNGSYVWDFDDLYILDTMGSAPCNDFLDDCRVDPRYPTGAGATTQWTPSAGSNWQNVDDATPDDDSTYNSTDVLDEVDTFVVQDAPTVGAAIYGIQHCLYCKRSDAGVARIAPVTRHSGVDYPGDDLTISTDYTYRCQTAAENPGTSAQWTEAHFNAAEFGYKKSL
jgi:hypothetical protein